MKPEKKFTKTQEMIYELKVRDVMTRNVITVSPEEKMSALREILRENRISGLPVTEGERLVGVISVEDFIKWLADRKEDCPIKERMTEQVVIVRDEDPLVLAVEKFEKTGVGRLPVLSSKGDKLVGIITKGDLIEGLLKKLEVDYHQEELRQYRAARLFEDLEADDTTLIFKYDVVGGDFSRAGTSSSRLKRTLRRIGVRTDMLRRIAIASFEAEMNQVIFTEGGTLRVQVSPKLIVLEAEDSGPGIEDIEKALQPGFSTAPEWVRELGFGAGMGLTNIQKCSDHLEIESGPGRGTLVRALFAQNEGRHS